MGEDEGMYVNEGGKMVAYKENKYRLDIAKRTLWQYSYGKYNINQLCEITEMVIFQYTKEVNGKQSVMKQTNLAE